MTPGAGALPRCSIEPDKGGSLVLWIRMNASRQHQGLPGIQSPMPLTPRRLFLTTAFIGSPRNGFTRGKGCRSNPSRAARLMFHQQS